MLFPALQCIFTDLLIGSGRDDDDPHHRFGVLQAINHTNAQAVVFDLKQACEVSVILIFH